MRAAIALGDLEKAEGMITEVATTGVPEADTQAKLKLELQKLKQDPKALLGLARKTLRIKNLTEQNYLQKQQKNQHIPGHLHFQATRLQSS